MSTMKMYYQKKSDRWVAILNPIPLVHHYGSRDVGSPIFDRFPVGAIIEVKMLIDPKRTNRKFIGKPRQLSFEESSELIAYNEGLVVGLESTTDARLRRLEERVEYLIKMIEDGT